MKTGLIAVTILAVLCGAAQAQCTDKVASFDLKQNSVGQIAVPVKINGTSSEMILDLSANYSFVSKHFANEAGLPVHKSFLRNHRTELPLDIVDLPTFEIGSDSRKITVEVAMNADRSDAPTGWLGLDVLSRYDFELDFGARKINFYAPSHCSDDSTAYWTHDCRALPILVHQLGNFEFPAEVNGEKVWLNIGSSTGSGLLRSSVAEERMGLKMSGPELRRLPDDGGVAKALFQTKGMKLGGIDLGAPELVVFDDTADRACRRTRACYGAEYEGTLSLAQAQALHIYVAYHHGMIYVSRADAK